MFGESQISMLLIASSICALLFCNSFFLSCLFLVANQVQPQAPQNISLNLHKDV